MHEIYFYLWCSSDFWNLSKDDEIKYISIAVKCLEMIYYKCVGLELCLLGVLEVHYYSVSLQHHMLSKLYITFFCNFSRWDLKLFKVSFGLSQFCAFHWRHYRLQNVCISKQQIRWVCLGVSVILANRRLTFEAEVRSAIIHFTV